MLCPSCGNAVHSAQCPRQPQGQHGLGLRAQVFEVIVRQAMAGAPWREICSGPMQVNRITEAEVEEEIRKRGGDSESGVAARKPTGPFSPFSSIMKFFAPKNHDA